MKRKRKTKIVATLGPACSDPAVLRAVLEAGVDVARFNMSHGSHQEHAERMGLVRSLSGELDREVAVLVDLQGPKIRTGRLKGGGPVELVEGATVTVRPGDFEGDAATIATAYEPLPDEVEPGDRILMDDGLLELRVQSVAGRDVACTVVEGGPLKERKGINLPGVHIKSPAVTAQDAADIPFAVEMDADYVALSFVREPGDVVLCRELVEKAGGNQPVIAKIEKPEAISHLADIVEVADGVMVARGDLGVEMSPEAVPVLQKRIINLANRHRRVVITATQMLESMIENPRPTRAEAGDVANAIFDGSDAVMLSGETAAGRHPVEAVCMMDRIAVRAETSPFFHTHPPGDFDDLDDTEHLSIVQAANAAYREYKAEAFLVYTLSGRTAVLLSKMRPTIPIVALSSDRHTVRRLQLAFGVTALLIDDAGDTDSMLAAGEDLVRSREVFPAGTKVIVLSGSQRVPGGTNMMQIRRL